MAENRKRYPSALCGGGCDGERDKVTDPRRQDREDCLWDMPFKERS